MNKIIQTGLLSALLVAAVNAEERIGAVIEAVADDSQVTITEHYQRGYRNRVEVAPRQTTRPYVLVDSDEDGVVDNADTDPRENDKLMMWSVRQW